MAAGSGVGDAVAGVLDVGGMSGVWEGAVEDGGVEPGGAGVAVSIDWVGISVGSAAGLCPDRQAPHPKISTTIPRVTTAAARGSPARREKREDMPRL